MQNGNEIKSTAIITNYLRHTLQSCRHPYRPCQRWDLPNLPKNKVYIYTLYIFLSKIVLTVTRHGGGISAVVAAHGIHSHGSLTLLHSRSTIREE